MQTDSWYLERRIYLAVGINISIAATGYCIMANGLYWLGAEPRLAPGRGGQGNALRLTPQSV